MYGRFCVLYWCSDCEIERRLDVIAYVIIGREFPEATEVCSLTQHVWLAWYTAPNQLVDSLAVLWINPLIGEWVPGSQCVLGLNRPSEFSHKIQPNAQLVGWAPDTATWNFWHGAGPGLSRELTTRAAGMRRTKALQLESRGRRVFGELPGVLRIESEKWMRSEP